MQQQVSATARLQLKRTPLPHRISFVQICSRCNTHEPGILMRHLRTHITITWVHVWMLVHHMCAQAYMCVCIHIVESMHIRMHVVDMSPGILRWDGSKRFYLVLKLVQTLDLLVVIPVANHQLYMCGAHTQTTCTLWTFMHTCVPYMQTVYDQAYVCTDA